MSDSDGKKPRRLWLRILFGVSLALNLLFVGLAAGAWWRLDSGTRDMRPLSTGAAIYRALPREERRALRRSAFEGQDAPRRERRNNVAELTRILRAESFDAQAASNILARERALREAHTDAMRNAWIDRISAMNQAERAAYAERIEARINRGGRKR